MSGPVTQKVSAELWPQWRHKKRGTTYTEMGRATMQVNGPLDMAKVVIYQSNADGSMWVRPLSEFEDGRFERVHT
jgi:hypothetical protein